MVSETMQDNIEFEPVNLKVESYSSKHYLPKQITQQEEFLQKYPEYDGRGILIAILDGGVDPSLPGLQKTTAGEPKIVDCLDMTGVNDVDTSVVKKVDKNGVVVGLTGRKLKIPSTWKNPTKKFHLGVKPIFELYSCSAEVKKRIVDHLEEEYQKRNKSLLAEIYQELKEHEEKFGSTFKKISDKEDRENISSKFEQLKNAYTKNFGAINSPIADCIVWFDGKTWKACIDISCCGDLENAKVLSSFREKHEWEYISNKCMVTYCVTIQNEGNLLEICVPNGSHGSHVAHIAAGHYPDNPEKDGIAPGAQVISITINGNLEHAIVRALHKCIELKVNVINHSIVGREGYVNSGNIAKLIKTAVEKHGIIFVDSAGNNGPALSTAGFIYGNVNHSVIDVGAYLTSEMKESMFNQIEAGNNMVFPFSGRGPCIDGSLGVSVVAPGAAIAGVSKQTLTSTELMQGTSMSAPYVCGSIACLISALKANNIPISPFQIKLALINSAIIPGKEHYDAYHSGYGLIQLNSAFELLKAMHDFLPGNVTDIIVDINGKRGIYLRQKWETNLPKEFIVNVDAKFEHSENLEQQIKFESTLDLKLSFGAETFIKIPKCVQLPSGKFPIHLDPTKLKPGKVHYAEIVGIDKSKAVIGPLFRVPITVIIPEEVTKENNYCLKKNVICEPGIPQRCFVSCPEGSVTVALIMKLKEGQKPAGICAQACTIFNQKVYFKETKTILHENEEVCVWIKTYENATIEICLAQNYLGSGTSNISAKIKFFGYSLNKSFLSSASLSNEIIFTNKLRGHKILPKLCFTKYCESIEPSNAVIHSSQSRENIIDKANDLCLLLTYNYKIEEKKGYIVCRFYIDGLKTFGAYLDSFTFQLFTASKKHVRTSGSWKVGIFLDNGDYIIYVKMRHSDPSFLEKLKTTKLTIKHKIDEMKIDFYSNAAEALMANNGKVKERYFDAEESKSLYIPEIPYYKLPSNHEAGSYLKGTFFVKYSENEIKASTKFIYNIFTKSQSKLNKPNIIEPSKESKEVEEELKELDLKTYSAKDLPTIKAIIDRLLKIIDIDKLSKFFAFNTGFDEEHDQFSDIFKNQKNIICKAYQTQSNLMLDEYFKNTAENDIPEAFKNGFNPRKKADEKITTKPDDDNEKEESKNGWFEIGTFENGKFEPALKETKKLPNGIIKAEEVTLVKLEEVEKSYRRYMLCADLTSENTHVVCAKFAFAHGRYGTALAELKKIIANKNTTSEYSPTEKAIIEVLDKLGWKHLADEERKAFMLKHQENFRLI